MAEDIGSYEFDFKREVEILKRDLGAQADCIMFIEAYVETPPEGSGKKSKVSSLIMAGKDIAESDISWMRDHVDYVYTKDPDYSSWELSFNEVNADNRRDGCPPTFSTAGGAVVCVNHRDSFYKSLGENNKEICHLYALYHETGHALSSDGCDVDDTHPYKEALADAYGALRILKRFGDEAIPYLSQWSWSRSFDAIFGSPEHFTTTVVDKILADSAHYDFSQLSVEEVVTFAKAYAEEWTPSASMMSLMNNAFQPLRDNLPYVNDLVGLLSSTCLSSETNPLAFYMGAKTLQPFLHQEGLSYEGREIKALSEEAEAAFNSIQARASRIGLQDIVGATNTFNGNAIRAVARMTKPAPLTSLLEVHMSPGQKHIIYNP